ncbi:MAG: nuclear transport factor 2 family protein [Burkholderiaceae bacterium]
MDQHAFMQPMIPYLEAFAERDPVHRMELLGSAMTPDAQIWGPKRVFAGYAEISDKIEGFHRNWPGCRLVITTGPNTFNNAARFGSAIVDSNGAVLASGQTVMELANDGRYQRVIPFWEVLPPLPADWPEHLAPRRESDSAA